MTDTPTLRKVVTADDSITCFHDETGELYHNRAGAYTEALKNYVEPSGIDALVSKGTINVLDVCFGLGYNTFVLLEELRKYNKPCQVKILGLDIDESILSILDEVLADKRFAELTKYMNKDVFAPKFGIYKFPLDAHGKINIQLEIRKQDIRVAATELKEDFDLIYHDGFSPYKVPELWTVDLFKRYYRLLKAKQGALLTYSASPAVRAGLRLAGFHIYATTALGSKHGGTLAITDDHDGRIGKAAQVLSDDQEERLKSSSGIPYRDESLNSPRESIIALRDQEQKLFKTNRL